jgi:hypothetical protein
MKIGRRRRPAIAVALAVLAVGHVSLAPASGAASGDYAASATPTAGCPTSNTSVELTITNNTDADVSAFVRLDPETDFSTYLDVPAEDSATYDTGGFMAARGTFVIDISATMDGPILETVHASWACGRPIADFGGDGSTDIGVFRPAVGGWYVHGQPTAFFGLGGDLPVPGDYDGDGAAERAVFRPSVGGWYIDGAPTVFFGLDGDIPVPADYDGDGITDVAVFRPSVGGWYIEGQDPVFYGLSTDVPVSGDYDGDGSAEVAIFRPEVGGWFVNGEAPVFHGLATDIPVPGDYDGNGTTDPAVFRGSSGAWLIKDQPTVYLGLFTDPPVPGDYDGDGSTDPAMFRSDTGAWYVDGSGETYHGLSGDIPTPKRPTLQDTWPTVTTTSVPDGEAGSPYLATFEATGGRAPYAWDVSGLPDGLTNELGAVTGNPAAAGTYPLVATVTDAAGRSATAPLELTVAASPLPAACQTGACAELDTEYTVIDVPAERVVDVGVDTNGQLQSISLTGTVHSVGEILAVPDPTGELVSRLGEITTVTPDVGDTTTYAVIERGVSEVYAGTIRTVDATVTEEPTEAPAAMASPFSSSAGGSGCSVSGSGSVTPHLVNTVKPEVDVQWDHQGVHRVQAFVNLEYGFSLEAQLTGTVDCTLNLPGLKAVAPVGPPGVFVIFKAQPSIKVTIDASVGASLNYTVKCFAIFGYNAGTDPLFVCRSPQNNVQVSTEAPRAVAELSGALNASLTLSDVIGLTGEISATLRGTFQPTAQPAGKIDVLGRATLAGCLACFLGSNAITGTIIDKSFGPKTLWGAARLTP